MPTNRITVIDGADAQDLALIAGEIDHLIAPEIPETGFRAIRKFLRERFDALNLGGDNSVELKLNDYNRRGPDSIGLQSVSVGVSSANGSPARLRGEPKNPTIGFQSSDIPLQFPSDGRSGFITAIIGFKVDPGRSESVSVIDGGMHFEGVDEGLIYKGTPRRVSPADGPVQIVGPEYFRTVLNRRTPMPDKAIREGFPIPRGIYVCTYKEV